MMAQQSNSAPEPHHIKSDVLGENLGTYATNNPGEKCAAPNTALASQLDSKGNGFCIVLGAQVFLSYANVRLIYKNLEFNDSRLVQVMMTISHSDYDTLRDGLIAKFGEPSVRSKADYQNRMGAHFSGDTLLWDNGVSTVMVDEFGGNLDTTVLNFAMDDYLKEQLKRRDEAKKHPTDM